MAVDIPNLTLIFMATVSALAMAFVWMFCEFERRFGRHVAAIAAPARFGRPSDRRRRD